jgi:hypothetical protein
MPQHLARQHVRELAVINRQPTVDQQIANAGRVLVRFVERGRVAERLGIEDDYVGETVLLLSTDSN